MTTKKQRREQTAAKTTAAREALAAENAAALKRSHDRQEQKRWDAERAANQKKAKAQMRKVAEAKKNESVPDNMQESIDNLFETHGSYGHAEKLINS